MRNRRAWPQWLWAVWLMLMLSITAPATAGLFDRLNGNAPPRVLAADQAFQLTITVVDAHTIAARWLIAPEYYLYRDKLQLRLENPQGVRITGLNIPPGEIKDDPYFGRQAVFHGEAVVVAHLSREISTPQTLTIIADYQGCAEVGVCYPPLSQQITVTLPAVTGAPPTETVIVPQIAAPDRLTQQLTQQRFWALPAFFGLGLLLAFTPCIFPMVPILSSLIVGGAHTDRRRALGLSLVYVFGMSLTYTVAGVLAALFGQNLQAWFQNPWMIGAFSGFFVLLAASMLGVFTVQLPNAWRQRLIGWSNRPSGGQNIGVAIMGALSALIVGPCVAPPLVGVLTFIAATGDMMLGAATLFALSVGMGVPLLLLGASAGHWLPKAGPWMEWVRTLFGVLLLAVALWLLERIVPAALIMVLWAIFLIVTATFMGALQSLPTGSPIGQMLSKGCGVVLLVYGILLLVGVAAGGRDPLQPLRGLQSLQSTTASAPEHRFRRVKTVEDVAQAVREAGGKTILLDFYADWCTTCKALERETFSDPAVRVQLAQMVTLQADVTANDAADRALLQHFSVIGPPTVLFFSPNGQEDRARRMVGFLSPEDFIAQVRGQ